MTKCLFWLAGLAFLTFVTGSAMAQSAVPLIPGVIGFDVGDDRTASPPLEAVPNLDFGFDQQQYVSWDFLPERDVLWLPTDEVGLIDAEEVARGGDAVSYWESNVTRGQVCDPGEGFHGPFLEDDNLSEDCAFTRPTEDGLEYCIYSRQGTAESDVQCQSVVEYAGAKTLVLASRSAELPGRGAGGEGLFICEFPDVSLDEAKGKTEKLLYALVGDAGIVEFREVGPRFVVSAKGTNITHFHENFFVRLNLIGEMASFDNGPQTYFAGSGSTGAGEDYFDRSGRGVMFSYSRTFTVSSRRSESIIDYREPSEIVDEAIYKAYSDINAPLLKDISPNVSCQFFQV